MGHALSMGHIVSGVYICCMYIYGQTSNLSITEQPRSSAALTEAWILDFDPQVIVHLHEGIHVYSMRPGQAKVLAERGSDQYLLSSQCGPRNVAACVV